MKSTKGQEFCRVESSERYQRPVLVGETKTPKGFLGETYRGAGKMIRSRPSRGLGPKDLQLSCL